MKKFSVGFAVGILLGAVVPATTATFVGRSGYLWGWEVTVNGTKICEDPFIWSSLREIECD